MSIGKKAFTLIELLIVVAIIAILAAIAVPNFLEAQVRSKVSRVKADQRSLATAVESYYVDNNSYPAVDSSDSSGGSSGFGINDTPEATSGLKLLPTFRRKQNTSDDLHTLTTPISYITSYFVDPFAKTRVATYLYSTPSLSLNIEVQNGGWFVWSFGPDADENVAASLSGDVSDMDIVRFAGENPRISETFYNPNQKTPSDMLLIYATYDPTNGTTSNGDVYRIKQ